MKTKLDFSLLWSICQRLSAIVGGISCRHLDDIFLLVITYHRLSGCPNLLYRPKLRLWNWVQFCQIYHGNYTMRLCIAPLYLRTLWRYTNAVIIIIIIIIIIPSFHCS